MTPPNTRREFEELVQVAEEGETQILELKNSSLLLFDHSLQEEEIKKNGKTRLKDKLIFKLSRSCSAFANATGGTFVIGIHDSGKLDKELIPETWGKTAIDKFVEDLLKAHIHPPLPSPDVYLLKPKDGSEKRLLVIDVPQGHRPHQASDLVYYVRRGKSIEALYDWEIEDIRNRRINPRLEPNLILVESKLSGADSGNNKTVTLDLVFNIENSGSAMANHWSFRLRCPFATEIAILPEADYARVNVTLEKEKGSRMARAANPLFPEQSVSFKARITVPAYWRELYVAGGRSIPAELAEFGWLGCSRAPSDVAGDSADGSKQWFFVYLEIFADNAPKRAERYSIPRDDFEPKMLDYLRRVKAESFLPNEVRDQRASE